jgi:hypothetical protein
VFQPSRRRQKKAKSESVYLEMKSFFFLRITYEKHLKLKYKQMVL